MNGLSHESSKLSEGLNLHLSRLVPFGFSGALLVAEGDTIIINEGYGLASRQLGVPNTRDAVFSLGSITKQFTATAILKLEATGHLRTEDAMARYLPGVPADKAGITLHHLLTHTAGLVNYVADDYEMLARDEAFETVLKAPLRFRAGERYAYSNAGYTLLAAIVEIVSGGAYEAFLRAHLFEPAGMALTGYRLPRWEERTIAHFHADDVDQGTNLDKPYPSWSLMGNGEMLSTTLDMYRWHRALMGDEILTSQAKRKLYQPFLGDYAYGWRVTDTEHGRLAEHGGASSWGSSAYYRRYLDADIVFIVFCNEVHNDIFLTNGLKDTITTLVFNEAVELPPTVPAVPDEELARFVGERQLRPAGRVRITARKTHLQVLPLDQQALDALFPQLSEEQGELGRRALEILVAAKQEDYQPLADARTKERPLEGALNLINNFLEGRSAEELILLGTVPSSHVPDALDTLITTTSQEETLLFVWKNGINVGCGVLGGDARAGFAVPCLPTGDSELIGYHVGARRAVLVKLAPLEG